MPDDFIAPFSVPAKFCIGSNTSKFSIDLNMWELEASEEGFKN